MSKEQGEALLHELGKTGLAGASIESHEDFIKGLEQRQGARFSETETSEIDTDNNEFNKELDDFKKGTHNGLLNVCRPGSILQSAGISKNLSLSPTVLNQHLKKGGLPLDDLKGLSKALQDPFMVYTHGKNNKATVIVTSVELGGNKLSLAVRVDENGNIEDLNNVASIHAKNAVDELGRLSEANANGILEFKRIQDTENALEWLGIASLNGSSHTTNPKHFSLAKVIKGFENPKVEDEKKRYQERFMRKGDGTIYGYFDEQGVAHFDESVMNGNTAIHEFGHPWQDWCKRTNPKLYERGVELINESPYIDEVRKEAQDPDSVYYGMADEQIVDEAIARAIGDKGEKMLEKHGVFKFAQLRDWLVGLWQSLKQKFGVGLNENLEDMILDEFTTIASRDILGGEKLHDKATGTDFTHEELSIIDTAKREGTHMKAPNGKPTKLTEKQWAQVRTKAFKEWFGDWEKIARIEKLRKAKAIEITGEEIAPSDDLKQYKKNALDYGKALRGEYTNKDTGAKVLLAKNALKEVLQHDYKDVEQLQSIVAIPKIIEESIYIDSEKNNDSKIDADAFDYYVSGLKIGGVDYAVRSVIVKLKDGTRYYDHKLTQIEKGKLIDSLVGTTPGFNQTESPVSVSKDKRLVSILQTNCSKVVDENGEPMVVYHGTLANGLHKFNKDFIGSRYSYDDKGFFFISRESIAKDYATSEFDATKKGEVIPAFISLQNPLVVDAVWCKKNGLGSNVFKDNDVIEFWDNYQSLMIEESEGKDGVVITDETTAMVVVFEPTQIKSATSNVGTFDGRNADIRYQQGNSDTRYRMGDDGASFEERRDKAVANKGTVLPGLTDKQVRVVTIPKHSYKGKNILRQAVEAATKRYNTAHVDEQTDKETWTPKTLHYENDDAEFDYEITEQALKDAAQHSSYSDNAGVHVAVMDKLDEVIGNSIEVEEHPDVLKKDGKREWENGFSDDVLIHRFMGAVEIDGKLYRVKTTMRENRSNAVSNKPYTYEVTKIEVLDETSPSTSNGSPYVSDVFVDGAKLLNGVEKSYEKGKKLLEESKKSGDPRFGYIGYSMSERAHQARMEGRYPKTDFKKEYDMPQPTLDALVQAGVIDGSEWHHTSKAYNKTTFYGWNDEACIATYKAHKAEIDAWAKGIDPSTGEALPAVDDTIKKSQA